MVYKKQVFLSGNDDLYFIYTFQINVFVVTVQTI